MAAGGIDGAVRGVGFVGGTKKDVDEGWFDVSFSANPVQNVLSLVNLEGGNLVRNSGEGLKFFFEGIV